MADEYEIEEGWIEVDEDGDTVGIYCALEKLENFNLLEVLPEDLQTHYQELGREVRNNAIQAAEDARVEDAIKDYKIDR